MSYLMSMYLSCMFGRRSFRQNIVRSRRHRRRLTDAATEIPDSIEDEL